MSAPFEELHRTWRRFVQAAAEGMALMSAAEQTRLSWANSIRTVEEIPPAYQAYLQANLPDLADCLPAVLTPTFRGFLRRENEKLVFSHAGRLFVLELTSSGLQPTVFPIAEINYIEVGAILLKAWLRISGLIDGQLASQTLKFNTVTQFLFDPLVSHLRFTLSEAQRNRRVSAAERTPQPFTLSEAERSRRAFTLSEAERNRRAQPDLQHERLKFDPLRELHYKFMSYARKSLQPGQQVIDYLMQPEMRLPRLRLHGRPLSMRTTDTAHLSILTDSELIVIRDDPSSLQSCNETRYGGVWDYIPLCRVLTVALEERENVLALALSLSGDERFELLFSPDHRQQAERLCAQIGA